MKTLTKERPKSKVGLVLTPKGRPPMILSATQINTYMTCPLKHHYASVLKIEPEETPVFKVFGRAMHSTLAHYWNGVKNAKPIKFDEMLKAFTKDWEIVNTVPVAYQEGENPKEFEAQGAELLRVYYVTQEELRKEVNVTAVEQGFKIPIVNPLTSETLPDVYLWGKLDLVLDKTVVEHKTLQRVMEQEKADEDIQMSCYALAHLLLYNELPESLRFDMLLKQKKPRLETLPTYRNLDDLARLYHTIAQVKRGIENHIVFPCYSWQCKNCEYNTDVYCKAWGRNGDAK